MIKVVEDQNQNYHQFPQQHHQQQLPPPLSSIPPPPQQQRLSPSIYQLQQQIDQIPASSPMLPLQHNQQYLFSQAQAQVSTPRGSPISYSSINGPHPYQAQLQNSAYLYYNNQRLVSPPYYPQQASNYQLSDEYFYQSQLYQQRLMQQQQQQQQQHNNNNNNNNSNMWLRQLKEEIQALDRRRRPALNRSEKNKLFSWKEIALRFTDRTLHACQFRWRKISPYITEHGSIEIDRHILENGSENETESDNDNDNSNELNNDTTYAEGDEGDEHEENNEELQDEESSEVYDASFGTSSSSIEVESDRRQYKIKDILN
ncbi:hypothetical protein CAS74_001537 [Pichia kudriavzevii]|uniref:Myb-like domain-containing protein n=1 Tax=Pichia kudriavzevii TaxID=4909 RepID=A0A1Z8JRK0_PICKU|nr:hypothetical protein CAS74_001537 [Pichia kudriavzevii]